MEKRIGIIGSGSSYRSNMLMKELMNFEHSVGKLIIVCPMRNIIEPLVEKMKIINPRLEIIMVDDLSGHPDALVINGTNNSEVARSLELKCVEVMREPIIVHDKKMQFGENYRRENRYRSDHHNFNAKSYRR